MVAWQEAIFALYVAEEKIEPEVVENMRSWEHSGFSVDQSVLLPAGDQAGIERLVQYMTRCPFSLSRLVKVSDTGQIVYQAEKQACRAFPDPKGDGTQAGVPRNFQILPPLDFLAPTHPQLQCTPVPANDAGQTYNRSAAIWPTSFAPGWQQNSTVRDCLLVCPVERPGCFVRILRQPGGHGSTRLGPTKKDKRGERPIS